MQERRIKGLCYNCDEKFTPGHRCKKLFLIEACYDGDNDVVMDEDETIIEDSKVVPEISLHAISRGTMQVKWTIGSLTTIVLVDLGSTHNFTSEDIAGRWDYNPKLKSNSKWWWYHKNDFPVVVSALMFKLLLQGIFHIFVDFYLLLLEVYDIVLETQWLRTLGQIIWDFEELQMSFRIANKEIILRG